MTRPRKEIITGNELAKMIIIVAKHVDPNTLVQAGDKAVVYRCQALCADPPDTVRVIDD